MGKKLWAGTKKQTKSKQQTNKQTNERKDNMTNIHSHYPI